MSINNLYKLEKKDIEKSAEIVSRAFLNYPMHRYIFGEKHNKENINLFSKFIIKYAVLYGEAYASSKEFEGIILFTDFKDYNFNFFRSLRCGILPLIKLGKEAGMRFNVYDEFTLRMHKKYINEPHQYLMLIGVDPQKQGQGFGSKLMLPVLKSAEEKGQSCYLETHDYSNVSLYKKFGFELVAEDIVPGTDIVQFSMIKR